MEKNELIRYFRPTVELVELTPEKGFAASQYGAAGEAGNGLNNEDEWVF